MPKTTPEEDLELCLGAIDAMEPHDREIATAIHELVGSLAPQLLPRTFYNMPAYAKNGKPVLFFQSGAKFKTRYSTLGFTEHAILDHGNMWPSAFAILEWSPEVETLIAQLIGKASGLG